MYKNFRLLFLVSLLLTFTFFVIFDSFHPATTSLNAQSGGADDKYSLEDSVVRIRSAQENDEEDEEEGGQVWQTGTGFIFKRKGPLLYILTVTHVVRGASEIYVEFRTRRDNFVPAKVLHMEGADSNGLAVITVSKFPENVRALPLSPISHKKLQAVTAIGFPRTGADWSVSQGFITGQKGRSIVFSAQVDGGNSGGPLLSREGQVLGIVASTKGKYGFATQTAIMRLTLKGWGVSLPGGADVGIKPVFKPGKESLFCEGESSCRIKRLIRTRDKNLLLAGEFVPGPDEATRGLVKKLNLKHGVLWEKTIEFPQKNFFPADIAEHPDGGFVVGGDVSSQSNPHKKQIGLIRLDPRGKVIWRKTYGGSKYDRIYALLVSSGGEILTLGETYSKGAGQSDVYLFKVTGAGKTLWQKTYGGKEHDSGKSIATTRDGNYIITGVYDSAKGDKIWLLKVNPRGDILLDKKIERIQNAHGLKVLEARGGGYLILARASMKFKKKYPAPKKPYFEEMITTLLKTDTSGQILWRYNYSWKKYRGIPFFLAMPTALFQNPDGSIILGGHHSRAIPLEQNSGYRFYRYANQGSWFEKLGSGGKRIWFHQFNLLSMNLVDVIGTGANEYVLAGSKPQADTAMKSELHRAWVLTGNEVKKIW